MKIALVRRRFSLTAGGAERYGVVLARQLRARGHDVTAIGESIDDELASLVEFVPVDRRRGATFSKTVAFARRAAPLVGRGRFDVVLGLARMPAVDVYRLTDRLHAQWMRVRYRHPVVRRLQMLNPRHRNLLSLERSVMQSTRVRRIIVQSKLDRRLVTEHYPAAADKLRTIYNGVDTETFRPGLDESRPTLRQQFALESDEPLFLFASAQDYRGKGLAAVIRSLQQMRLREARLLVAGNGRVRRFSRLAKDLGIAHRVIFAHRQEHMQRFFASGDLLVLPAAYEPFPNVTLESMACGTPVLTAPTSGAAEVVDPGHSGYVVSGAEAIHEIAALMDHQVSLPGRDKVVMRQHCRRQAERFSLERHVDQLVQVLEEVQSEKADA